VLRCLENEPPKSYSTAVAVKKNFQNPSPPLCKRK